MLGIFRQEIGGCKARFLKVLGTRIFLVELNIGKVVKRHVNQLKYHFVRMILLRLEM